MLIVGTDPIEVEGLLLSGELRCPSCGAALGPWGHARPRSQRGRDGTVRLVPRRARCAGCRATHVLLAERWLLRRADEAGVIGAALEAKAAGSGHRPIAAQLGRPVSTVRGWLRRFTARAEQVRAEFTRLLYALEGQAPAVVPRGSVVGDAVEVIGRAAAAAVVRLSPMDPWHFAVRATGGFRLSPAPGRGW